MIVLVLSQAETAGLLNSRPSLSQGLKEYLMRELRMETLLPDENLPETIVLEKISQDERGYQVIVRTYADRESCDLAWAAENPSSAGAVDPHVADLGTPTTRDVSSLF